MGEPPADTDTTRASGQVVGERTAGEVSDVLLTIERALDRARGAHAMVTRDDRERLTHAGRGGRGPRADRKRLTQDTYYAGDERLL